ncbi:COP9 signalosome complex subunit 2 [Wickerhamomyces ciferrii]|uniref:COP9 signalosome complex subunit 2 n=1 Tax=Wickerhamomyces ciferrii (strain ATCC 14091 / BCRC 22168 / CBS 111 / JCM 3599 / NBRC 0793 / NRRL Y-1031 F-60-10) TaxID=1206466 RepID=K0KE94_WICCF|nr:COP9 signalosome complex subunit 2 [Wickerhamomyces ciferrii]CCH43435.1 COP9 signalosome complex subunit 2 [Wickerhamomyces ciferrii]
MSDEEDFMMSDGDGESYDFEFEDDDDGLADEDMNSIGDEDQSDGNGDDNDENSAEALYYNAKNTKQDDPERAIGIYEAILKIEDSNSDSSVEELIEYKFKALKQLIKIEYKLEKYDGFISHYRQIFQLDLNKITRGYVEDSLSRILDSYIGLPSNLQLDFLNTFIQDCQNGNDRLNLKANLKKIHVFIELKKLEDSKKLLNHLYELLDKMSELTKNTYLLELYSIEIQLHSDDNTPGAGTKLKELYRKTLSIQSTIPHPRINAIIKECGGKMYMKDENYEQASIEFYESFKNYDEVGNQSKRIIILKYLIITSILSNNEINKFESQETKFFLKDERILKYIKLINTFESLKHDEFMETLNLLFKLEKDDGFLIQHLKTIEKIFKLQTLINYIKPFKRLSILKICEKLNLNVEFIEDSFLNLSNNEQIKNIKLDFIEGVIYNNA